MLTRAHGIQTQSRRCHSATTAAGTHAATVAVAFTAPMHATARVDTHGLRPKTPTTTHGASMEGHVSEEIAPSVVNVCGESTNAAAPHARASGVPVSNVSASFKYPDQPIHRVSDHHIRCATQSGSGSVSRKNKPCGNR